jgi:hypothetical protein
LVVPIHGNGLQHYSIAGADSMNKGSEIFTTCSQDNNADNRSLMMRIASPEWANRTSIANPIRMRGLIKKRNPDRFHQISTGC